MNSKEIVSKAKQSFERVLDNEKYVNIIKDDKHLKLLLEMIEGKQCENILDIGTGTGYLAFPLAQINPSAQVYGIDIAENIVEKNQSRAQEDGISNVKFLSFDGVDYPFEDSTFDLMVTRHAFHHFPKVDDAVKKLSKILKEGGSILIADPMKNENDTSGVIDRFMDIKGDGHVEFYSKTKLEGIFASHGFVVEKQIITTMTFPFPPKREYVDLFNSISEKEKSLYQIEMRNGIVWVGNIEVGNTLFVK